jgi:hypothetical protein
MYYLSNPKLDRNQPDLEPVKSGNKSEKINAFIEPIAERDYQDFHEEKFSQSLHIFGGRFTNNQSFEI